ncbi:immunity 53 family protein [Amycolatopsis aidingensis]|uniref:immunity 53 family protein n=1 Tax=Amycolatopsis aidingensis TaxID=2842453 RepID=UPI001C0C1C42|nr:immunity 53 family protein [Amycolatopsis aidingensis]
MAETNIEFLQRWYRSWCDQDWEHQYGVKIETIDNPGWLIRIDLEDTNFQGVSMDLCSVDRDEFDWMTWRSDGRVFEVACGPGNLDEALGKFREFVDVSE